MNSTQVTKNIFVAIGVMSIASSVAISAPIMQWDLLTVSNTNTLMRVDIGSGPNFSASSVGVTQDIDGTVRQIRGLAYAGSALYGMTRQGDLVGVNQSTGVTTFLHSVGTSSGDFWSDLAYDASSNSLYTVNAFGGHSLVRIDLGTMTHTVQGSTQWTGGNGFQSQILGLEFMNGELRASNRQNDNIVDMDPNTGMFDFTWGNQTSGVPNQQQIALNPDTGVLWGINDHFSSNNNAALSTFDSTTFQSTEMGMLPFGIVETVGGGNDTYGWGGIVFVPAIPSPSSASLLMLGGLTVARRRRR